MNARSFLAALILAAAASQATAQDPDIDRLLKKLPPPEKLVNTRLAPGIRSSDPAFHDPLAKELDAAVRARNAGRALAAARTLCTKYPRSVAAHLFRGVFALQVKQLAEAAEAFRQTTVLDPKLPIAQLGAGVSLGAESRFAAALPYLQRATELDPKALPALLFLSACYERLGQKREAAQAARHATQLAPNVAAAWAQLARTESALGNRPEALLAVGKAARLSPGVGVAAAVTVRGLDVRRPVEGIRILHRAIELEPNNSLLRKQLRSFEEIAAQANKTVARLEQRTAADPNSSKAWLELAAAYEQVERHSEARAAFAKAQRLQPPKRPTT